MELSKDLFTTYTKSEVQIIKDAIMEDSNKYSPAMLKLIESKKYFHIFKGLTESDIKQVITDVNFKKFKKGEIVLKQGQVSDEIYYIVQGDCNVVVDRKVVGKLSSNQVFGEIASIAKQPRTATVRSISDTTAISFRIQFEDMANIPYPFAVLFRNFTFELIKKLDNANK
jgi:CRP-like cAMP-binding protein